MYGRIREAWYIPDMKTLVFHKTVYSFVNTYCLLNQGGLECV